MTGGEPAAGRRCILEEAQRLFASRGYHGVSIRDIVQACGLSNAALYYYFGSKQNLYVEVIRGFVDALIFGILIGTYSSIFVAAPLLLFMNLRSNEVDVEAVASNA